MGTSLTGLTPATTYDALIKVGDNGPLSATAKYLSDGLGNDSVLALSTGNVGVGTTTITTISGTNPVLTIGGTAISGGLVLQRSGTDKARLYESGDLFIHQGMSSVGHSFYVNASTEAMRITSAGNVGIGTSAPSEKLEIAADADPKIRFLDTGNLDAKVGIVGSTALGFEVNGAERARITSDGYFRLAGGGIQFNGDTAAANALDDYEEGTWTMGVAFGGGNTGVTYSLNTGTYTKIGRQVTVNGFLVLSNKGSSTGAATITGLPFTIANTTGNLATASLRLENITFTNQFQAYGGTGTTIIILEEITVLGTITDITNADFVNDSKVLVNLTYFV